MGRLIVSLPSRAVVFLQNSTKQNPVLMSSTLVIGTKYIGMQHAAKQGIVTPSRMIATSSRIKETKGSTPTIERVTLLMAPLRKGNSWLMLKKSMVLAGVIWWILVSWVCQVIHSLLTGGRRNTSR